MRLLKWLFWIALVGITAFVTCFSPWEFELVTTDKSAYMEMKYAPICAPPSPPTYSHMHREYRDLTLKQYSSLRVRRSLQVYDMVFAWLAGLTAGVSTSVTSRKIQNTSLTYNLNKGKYSLP